MNKKTESPLKIYLDISLLYPKDVPELNEANRLAGLVMYILEDHLPLDLIERFCRSLNWSVETRAILEIATNQAYQKMQSDIAQQTTERTYENE